jgi:hypothetical protein
MIRSRLRVSLGLEDSKGNERVEIRNWIVLPVGACITEAAEERRIELNSRERTKFVNQLEIECARIDFKKRPSQFKSQSTTRVVGNEGRYSHRCSQCNGTKSWNAQGELLSIAALVFSPYPATRLLSIRPALYLEHLDPRSELITHKEQPSGSP